MRIEQRNSKSAEVEGKSDDANDSCEFNAQQVAFYVCLLLGDCDNHELSSEQSSSNNKKNIDWDRPLFSAFEILQLGLSMHISVSLIQSVHFACETNLNSDFSLLFWNGLFGIVFGWVWVRRTSIIIIIISIVYRYSNQSPTKISTTLLLNARNMHYSHCQRLDTQCAVLCVSWSVDSSAQLIFYCTMDF